MIQIDAPLVGNSFALISREYVENLNCDWLSFFGNVSAFKNQQDIPDESISGIKNILPIPNGNKKNNLCLLELDSNMGQ